MVVNISNENITSTLRIKKVFQHGELNCEFIAEM